MEGIFGQSAKIRAEEYFRLNGGVWFAEQEEEPKTKARKKNKNKSKKRKKGEKWRTVEDIAKASERFRESREEFDKAENVALQEQSGWRNEWKKQLKWKKKEIHQLNEQLKQSPNDTELYSLYEAVCEEGRELREQLRFSREPELEWVN